MTFSSIAFIVVLALNTLWFTMGFWYFSLKPDSATRLLVPKSARSSPLFDTLSASVRFLGAMNFAFATLSALLLLNIAIFPEPQQRALFAAVFAVTHAGQFLGNVPIALSGGRQGESLWPVTSGPMMFIFSTDFALMLANAVVAVALWLP